MYPAAASNMTEKTNKKKLKLLVIITTPFEISKGISKQYLNKYIVKAIINKFGQRMSFINEMIFKIFFTKVLNTTVLFY